MAKAGDIIKKFLGSIGEILGITSRKTPEQLAKEEKAAYAAAHAAHKNERQRINDKIVGQLTLAMKEIERGTDGYKQISKMRNVLIRSRDAETPVYLARLKREFGDSLTQYWQSVTDKAKGNKTKDILPLLRKLTDKITDEMSEYQALKTL